MPPVVTPAPGEKMGSAAWGKWWTALGQEGEERLARPAQFVMMNVAQRAREGLRAHSHLTPM
eukprot:2344752-Prymnesium_polylepis.1